MTGTYCVVGASRGLGAAVAKHLEAVGHRVITASRSPAAAGDWVAADVATDAGIDAIAHAVGDAALDGLLYMGGIWEAGAFTKDYDFAASPRDETRAIIDVNLVAPILLAQALTDNLARADDPRIVLMGSLSGLDNFEPVEVANTASKFGLRGAAQALAVALRPAGVGVTIINPGNIATPEVEEDIATGAFGPQVPIAIADVLATLDYILATSKAATPQEINLFQRRPKEGAF